MQLFSYCDRFFTTQIIFYSCRISTALASC